jgi:hypothetical protein
MPAILRWFEHEGTRHRVYFRSMQQGGTGRVVIAGPGWLHTVDRPEVTRLEDLTDDDLQSLAEIARSSFLEEAG